MMNKTRLMLVVVSSIGLSSAAFSADMASPPNSLVVTDTGDVGIGTDTPAADLHVVGEGVGENEQLLRLESTVPPEMVWLNSSNGREWAFRMTAGNNFNMNYSGNRKFTFFKNGDLVIVGALTQGSDRNNKQDIVAVDSMSILETVAKLPVSTWEYKGQDGVKHLGPMAQDFHAAFGLGDTTKGISSIDTGGVALAAIKGLHQVVQEKEKEIESLKERLTMLENLVNKLTAKEVVMNQ